MQIHEIDVPPGGRVVHLKAYGFIKVFKIVSKDGDIEYWATDLLDMDESEREKMGLVSWNMEEYHRDIKQFVELRTAKPEKVNPRGRTYYSL